MSEPTAAGSLHPIRTETTTFHVSSVGPVEVTVRDRDRTRSFLLLHGGGGPATMTGFADLLGERTHSRVLVPTHPGFSGTPKNSALAGVSDLAKAYIAMLDTLDLSDVTVVGNSFGGWLAAEIALQGSPRVSGGVIINGIGIEVDDHPVADVSGLTHAELEARTFHDPRRAPTPSNTGGTAQGPDIPALLGYTGPTMSDPTLAKAAHRHTPPVPCPVGRERPPRHSSIRQGLRRRDPDGHVHATAAHGPHAAGRDARGAAGHAARPRCRVTTTPTQSTRTA